MDLFEMSGAAVAYVAGDGESIYLWSGEAAAYLKEDSVYSYSGKHLGYFNDGWIRDDRGEAVVFTDASTGGPVRPVRQVHEVRGVRKSDLCAACVECGPRDSKLCPECQPEISWRSSPRNQ